MTQRPWCHEAAKPPHGQFGGVCARETEDYVNHKTIKLSLSSLSLAILSVTAHAQSTQATGLAAAVQQAINNNPDVTARLNALRAAANEVDVARGQYLPSVDLSASVGRDSDRITSRSPASQSLSRTGLALSASQILWDGMATSKEVSRLGHARLTRYFEFLGCHRRDRTGSHARLSGRRTLPQAGEPGRRQLRSAQVRLQPVADQVKAGVGRGVDSEQANARLALADSNLTTEVANLHDVSARYLRIVGDLPTASSCCGIEANWPRHPAGATIAINQALAKHPSISAAIENLRAAQAQAQGVKALTSPSRSARTCTGVGKNFDGVQDQKRDTTAELLLNWNLYNGGSTGPRAPVRRPAQPGCRPTRPRLPRCAPDHGHRPQRHPQAARPDWSPWTATCWPSRKPATPTASNSTSASAACWTCSTPKTSSTPPSARTPMRNTDLQLAYARTQAGQVQPDQHPGPVARSRWHAELVQDWQAPTMRHSAARSPPSTWPSGHQPIATSSMPAPASWPSRRCQSRRWWPAPSAPAPVIKPRPRRPVSRPFEQRLRDWAGHLDGQGRRPATFTYYAKDFAPSTHAPPPSGLRSAAVWSARPARSS
jgi:adhesin transport system outer membrane protein